MQSIDEVVDFLVVQVGAGREESVEIPQLLLVVAWTPLLTCPLVCNNRCWVLIVFGRALCTGTGPLFDPRHQGGEGVAGTPGVLTPRSSTTRINCMPIGVYGETHMSSASKGAPPTCMAAARAYGGAAGSRGKSPPQRQQGGDGQRPTVTEQESWQGGGGVREARRPTAQKTPPPGERPGILAEPGPQRSDRTVRRSSGETPLLVVASLAAAAADGVDAVTLSFLKAQALEDRRKEEEEERKVMEELDVLCSIPIVQLTPLQRQRLAEHRRSGAVAAREERRRKKKRKKKKLPKTSSGPPHRRAPQRQVPAVHRVHCVSLRHVVDVPGVQVVQIPVVVMMHLSIVPFWRRQAQDAPHPGRYGPEGLLQWYLHGWFCL